MMSDARVKCVPNTMIIGVGCGKSYSISNPTRIFIRSVSHANTSTEDRNPSLACGCSARRSPTQCSLVQAQAPIGPGESRICRCPAVVRVHPGDGDGAVEYKA